MSTNPYVYSGLNSGNQYDIYVRSLCAESNSQWIGPSLFSTGPNCPSPGAINISNYNGFSASIDWSTDYNESSWEVIVQPENVPPLTSGVIVNSPHYDITNLDPDILYTISIRAFCNEFNEFSEWSLPEELNYGDRTNSYGHSCYKESPLNKEIGLIKFINLLNHLRNKVNNNEAIPNGYSCIELCELSPYIIDNNPAIYNFQNDNGTISFSFHNELLNENYISDVKIYNWLNTNNNDIDSSNTDVFTFFEQITLPSNLSFVLNNFNLVDGTTLSKIRIKHIDFCLPTYNILNGEILPRQIYECGTSFTTGYSFSTYNPNDQYSWTFLDPNGNVVATSNLSGTDPVTFNQAGINTVNLVITTTNGCTYNFSYQVELVECDPEPICETHISFNFATPNGTLNNNIRLELGTGIVNFINENLNSQLYITSIDDFSGGGVRFRPAQQTFSSPWDQPFLNASNEVRANANLSIQNDNYSNTIINEMGGIISNTLIDKKINVTFVFASQDNFSSIVNTQTTYNNYLNSGKTDKVFFILFENGVFKDNSTNTNLSPVNFVNAVTGGTAVNFDATGSVLDSNYKVFTTSEYTNANFDQIVQQFMQNAYDDIIDVSCDDEPCLDIVGQIVNRNTTFCVGEKIDFGFNTSNTIVNYSWSAIDANTGNVLNTYTFGDIFTTLFPIAGNYIITLEVVNDQGCSSQFTYNVNATNCEQTSCTKDNQNSQVVKQLFINLLNHLKSQQSVPNGYTCAELTALAPYITDDDPKIYNYSNTNATTQFWFHPVQGKDIADVLLQKWNSTYPDVLEVDLSNYQDPYTITNLNSLVRLIDNTLVERSHVRHIDFCPKEIVVCTKDNSTSLMIEGLLIDLVHDLIQMKLSGVPNSAIEGTVPNSLNPLLPYITDVNSKIWNFYFSPNKDIISFSFSKDHKDDIVFQGFNANFTNATSSNFELDLSTYTDPHTGILLTGYQYDRFAVKKIIIKHIDFCPSDNVSCTATNPNSQVVKGLFIDLINFLITQNSLPNGYTCSQLTLLAPYVQPDDPVAIYNFTNTGYYIRFSFSDHGEDHDVQIPYLNSGININDLGLQNYFDFETTFQVDTHLSNGYIDSNKGYAKHIEFCPDELYCKHHVAIVVDESGSIDFMEAAIIREQLKSFINKQVDDNNTLGTNMHVSLIGLSDSDDPASRTDHIIGNQKIDNSNINNYLHWIDEYRNNVVNRTNPSSDYWAGGLERALEVEPDLVILITDGCQTSSAINLKTIIRKFNNHNGNSEGPHLFVVGLDNGFYIDSDTPLNGGRLSMNQDPNYNPELTRTSATGRVTSFLRKSLKYLMEYNDSDFPIKDKYNFIYNQSNEMVDYFGANDFRFLRDEINYLSNGLVINSDSSNENEIELSCGNIIPLEECNNCLNFKPIPGKEYILSAWVKEEQNFQVMSYILPKINVRFYDYTKENETSSGSPVECTTKGDIIDGWQRIFKKFVIPSDAVYINIELLNTSGSVPVYFDDIRIHPVDGSMKSFVYDPETFRLMSELDENNYSTFYEYDKEGGLIRVKKETSRGVKTIQETRSGNVIKE